MFSLEVFQSSAPYANCQTRDLVSFLSFSVFLWLLIHPSFPSHLLHHLCSCNKQESLCSLSPPCFLFPPDSGPSLSPGMASPTKLFDWLVWVAQWRSHAARLAQMFLSDMLLCHYTASPASKHCFQPSVRASVNVITLNMLSPWHVQDMWWLNYSKQNHHSKVYRPRSIFKTSSATAHYCSEPVITMTSHSAGKWKKLCEIFCVTLTVQTWQNRGESQSVVRFFFNHIKRIPSAGKGHCATLQMVIRLFCCPYWLYTHQNNTTEVGKQGTSSNTAKSSTASQWHIWATVLNVFK